MAARPTTSTTPTTPASPERSLRDFYAVLFRYRRQSQVFFVLVIAAVLLGNAVAQKIYLSEAKLMVRLGRESVSLDPTATTGQVMSVGQDRESEINSEIEILKSRELLEQLVETLGADQFSSAAGASSWFGKRLSGLKSDLKTIFKPLVLGVKSWFGPAADGTERAQARRRSEIAEDIRKKLSVQAIKKSNIIVLSYQTLSPELAQRVVAKLVDLYLDKHISVYRTAGSHQFFREQTEQLRRAIEATEKRIKDLKNATGMASLEDRKKVLVARVAALEQGFEQTGNELAASRAKAASLEERLQQLPKTKITQQVVGFPDSAREELRKSINNLTLREQELLATYTEQNVQVREIRRQIREARALYGHISEQSQTTQGINAAYQQTELSLLVEQSNRISLEARYEALRRQLTEAREEVKKLNEVEVQLARLDRELALENANFKKYSDSLEQTRIDQALETEKISNISVVQPASYPMEPIRPNKLMNLIVGVILGLLGGIGLAFLADHQDHTLKSPQEIERRLQLPVWATVSDWTAHPGQKLDLPGEPDQAPAEICNRMQVPRNFGHQWDPLWNSLNTVEGDQATGVGSCLVTSWRAGEGVTTVAVQLALALVRRGEGRVLLVDANVADPHLHDLLDCRESPGLADMLAAGPGRAGLIQATAIPNLDLLAGGSPEARSALLAKTIDTDLMQPLLDTWGNEYRLILFDGPPLGHNGHSTHWLKVADAIVWVIEAEGVRREVLEAGKDRLRLGPNNRLGVVLNKRRFYVPDWLYGTL